MDSFVDCADPDCATDPACAVGPWCPGGTIWEVSAGGTGQCFQYFSTPTTWQNAKTACEGLTIGSSSSLAVIDSTAENTFARNVSNIFTQAWIGFEDSSVGGSAPFNGWADVQGGDGTSNHAYPVSP